MIDSAESLGPTLMPGAIATLYKGEMATLLGVSVDVQVNDSRWIAMCVCHGAQVAAKTDRRFFCVDCGRGWVTVNWPSDEDVTAIEQVLSLRPDRHTRSWDPGESVDDLREQNLLHGVSP